MDRVTAPPAASLTSTATLTVPAQYDGPRGLGAGERSIWARCAPSSKLRFRTVTAGSSFSCPYLWLRAVPLMVAKPHLGHDGGAVAEQDFLAIGVVLPVEVECVPTPRPALAGEGVAALGSA